MMELLQVEMSSRWPAALLSTGRATGLRIAGLAAVARLHVHPNAYRRGARSHSRRPHDPPVRSVNRAGRLGPSDLRRSTRQRVVRNPASVTAC
jgi:hypothetical protein